MPSRTTLANPVSRASTSDLEAVADQLAEMIPLLEETPDEASFCTAGQAQRTYEFLIREINRREARQLTAAQAKEAQAQRARAVRAILANVAPAAPTDPAEVKHERYRWHGPKQGTECECRAIFYPVSAKGADVEEAWRFHVFEATGLWPQEPSRR